MALEARQETYAVLTRWTRETQAGIQGADVVLIGQICGVQGGDVFGMLPGELSAGNAPAREVITQRRVFKQSRPLRSHVAIIQPGREGVLIAHSEFILRA